MPGLTQKNDRFSNGSTPMFSLCSSNGFWSKHSDKVNYNQLQKVRDVLLTSGGLVLGLIEVFNGPDQLTYLYSCNEFWNELSPQARQDLLRIDKQTLFEQARKNMYCSRCNGLLLEGFLQIIMYGKSLQQEGTGGNLVSNRPRVARNQNASELTITGGYQDEILDPSVHPWGGLTPTRDGSLTLMDCYLYSKTLKGLQNVFDSARARERERELLYPDACGVGGRGWISQGMAGYGRGHGTRETCALHTARLSCDTLVDFWSALGDETRHSLLRMKEEDFIERLMYRFDSKRFCRDCRRNVIREFKELKELKRLRKEPRCTTWFCVADTSFQYEVSYDTVQADWCDTFADIVGTYHHFEWAVGTGEGKSDILEFENVGLIGSVKVNGLDLSGLSSCFITLRAWKLDGRCTELCVKAHALNAGQCVHCQLVVGDGFVTIKSGESIRRFFELAEEAEEEEDDDSMDKDGNEMDGECSRPQKHAKSPELAREFLLDVATVIFKEQVEKAFREGTARQNAHSIFVSLALKLLEERVHVACKEIITLEKQMKLLEEEEKEKREEEERKERRRAKEREKKLRRKERLKGKEKNRNKECYEENQNPDFLDVSKDESLVNIKEPNNSITCNASVQSRPRSPQIQEQQFSKGCINSRAITASCDGETTDVKEGFDSCTVEQSKTSHCRLKHRKQQMEPPFKLYDRHRYAVSESGGSVNKSEARYSGASFESPSKAHISNRHVRLNGLNSNFHHCGPKQNERFQSSGSRMTERYGIHHYSSEHNNEYRATVEPHVSAVAVGRDVKSVSKSESASDISKQFFRVNKYNHNDHMRDLCGRQKSKIVPGINSSGRDLIHPKKVWEPVESRKKYPRSNSDSDVTLKSSAFNVRGIEPNNDPIELSGRVFSGDIMENSGETGKSDNKLKASRKSAIESDVTCRNGLDLGGQPSFNLKETANEQIGSSPDRSALKYVKSALSVTSALRSSTSSSDNCSSCLSEGDSNTASSNNGNQDSSISDSEDSSQQSEGKEITVCNQNDFSECHSVRIDKKNADGQRQPNGSSTSDCLSNNGAECNMLEYPLTSIACGLDNKFSAVSLGSQHQRMLPPLHNQNIQFPVFQAPTSLGYYNQNPVSWPAATDELMPFPHLSHYMYTGPLGFGINGNSSFCMPYGSVQHLTNPLFAPGPVHVPIYQSIPEGNGLNMEEHTSMPGSMREAPHVANIEECIDPVGPQSTQTASGSKGLQNEDSGKWHTSKGSFSLFHFGGPVALSNGCKSIPLHSKEERVGDFSSKCPTDPVDTDNKGATVEEYNLFAANNGIKFSIF